MIELDKNTLRQLQLTELELMQEVDRICRKNRIKYSLDGGTLLGAVRHGGFIPWDDDADIMMSRAEYDRFYEACKTDLDWNRYFLQEFRTDKDYRWGYSKLRKNGTVFLREGQEHVKCHSGICIDIFIFDEVPDGFIQRRLHWCMCFLIRKGLYSVVGRKNAGSKVSRCSYGILAAIPRSFWVRCLMKLARNEEGKDRKLISHLTYPNRKTIRYGLSSSYYNDYVELHFEGYPFMAVKEYDRYLTELFDNYMELPPEGKRKVHPVTKLKI